MLDTPFCSARRLRAITPTSLRLMGNQPRSGQRRLVVSRFKTERVMWLICSLRRGRWTPAGLILQPNTQSGGTSSPKLSIMEPTTHTPWWPTLCSAAITCGAPLRPHVQKPRKLLTTVLAGRHCACSSRRRELQFVAQSYLGHGRWQISRERTANASDTEYGRRT